MVLVNQMLKGAMRDFIIRHKGIFEKAIIAYAKILPEPTKDNILHPNTQKLLDMRDKFFLYEDNRGKEKLFGAGFKILIAEYEHDPYYHYRFDWLLEEIVNSGWKPRPMGYPNKFWREPEPYGGGYLVKYGGEQ